MLTEQDFFKVNVNKKESRRRSSGCYLGGKVVKAEDESPVEVSFSGQRVEVDVGLLLVVLQPFDPPAAAEANRAGCSLFPDK